MLFLFDYYIINETDDKGKRNVKTYFIYAQIKIFL